MKQRILHITILVALLIIPGCLGGNGGNEDPGGLGGPGLAPIVNAGGDVFSDNSGAPPVNICPQENEELLELEISEIRNAPPTEGDEYEESGLDIYMGDNHHAPGIPPNPSEPYVEIDLNILRLSDPDMIITSDPKTIQLHIVRFQDWENYHNNLIPFIPKIGIFGSVQGMQAIESGNVLAFFNDSFYPGAFDEDNPDPSANFFDSGIIVIQICEASVSTTVSPVSSNPLFLNFERGNSPNETNDPPNTIIQPL